MKRETIDDLMANAKRLYEDAMILRKARRYPSAVALAVLALEEAGKVVLALDLFFQGEPIPKGLRGHKLKQRAAGHALVGSTGVDELRIMLAARGKAQVIRPIGSTKDLGTRKKGEKPPTLMDVLAQITEDEFERLIAPIIRNVEQNRLILSAVRGEFDGLKQHALYVDIDEAGAVKGRPKINRDKTDRILRLTSRAIWTIGEELRSRLKTKNPRFALNLT